MSSTTVPLTTADTVANIHARFRALEEDPHAQPVPGYLTGLLFARAIDGPVTVKVPMVLPDMPNEWSNLLYMAWLTTDLAHPITNLSFIDMDVADSVNRDVSFTRARSVFRGNSARWYTGLAGQYPGHAPPSRHSDGIKTSRDEMDPSVREYWDLTAELTADEVERLEEESMLEDAQILLGVAISEHKHLKHYIVPKLKSAHHKVLKIRVLIRIRPGPFHERKHIVAALELPLVPPVYNGEVAVDLERHHDRRALPDVEVHTLERDELLQWPGHSRHTSKEVYLEPSSFNSRTRGLLTRRENGVWSPTSNNSPAFGLPSRGEFLPVRASRYRPQGNTEIAIRPIRLSGFRTIGGGLDINEGAYPVNATPLPLVDAPDVRPYCEDNSDVNLPPV
ncbi:hypothetical protein C8R47DRAFT_1064018 [Mycena vitilis]|nr:hypothetical protein C8R47DRAFT_1064018 [Mycena vitilis]